MADFPAYYSGILAARNAGLRLSEAQAAQFVQLLQDYAAELEALVASGLASGSVGQVRKQTLELIDQLNAEMAASLTSGVQTTARRVAELHAQATTALLASGHPELAASIGTGFAAINTRAAQAVLARPEFTGAMSSIRQEMVAKADQVLLRGIASGATAEETARALRLSIHGSEGIPTELLLDRRRIGKGSLAALGLPADSTSVAHMRAQADRIHRRAMMIARTEIMTAEHEASAQAAIESPVVGLLQWYTSQRHPERDACDALAEVDWYGFGPGIYDPRRVPARPHPRCLCGTRHLLRDPEEWGKPKPQHPGALQHSPIELALDPDGVWRFTPSEAKSLSRAIGVGVHSRAPGLPVATAAKALPSPAAKAATAHARESVTRAQGKLTAAKGNVAKLKDAVASTKKAQVAAAAAGSQSAQAAAGALRAEASAQLKAKQAANKASAEKHLAKKQAAKQTAVAEASAAVQAAQEATVAAKKNVAGLKDAIAQGEQALAVAKATGDKALIGQAEGVLEGAKATLAEKQAANKASAEKHLAKKQAAAQAAKAKAAEAKQQAKAAAVKATPAPQAAPGAPIAHPDGSVVLHEKVGGQAGSNPGGTYRGSDGVLRYVKEYSDPAQARGEALANRIYRDLGAHAPESFAFEHQGKHYHAATIIESEGTLGASGLTAERAAAILDHFAADVLTANWDAVGTGHDNIVVLANGKLARIDQGGTFLFRAKAGRKPAGVLNSITEWDVFSGKSGSNPYYKQVFDKAGLTTPEQIASLGKQVADIRALREAHGGWAAYVDRFAPGLAYADRQQVVTMLEYRTLGLEQKAAQAAKVLKEEAEAAAKAAKAAAAAAAQQEKLKKGLADVNAQAHAAAAKKLSPEDARTALRFQHKIESTLSEAERRTLHGRVLDNVTRGGLTREQIAVRDRLAAIRHDSLVDTLVRDYGFPRSTADAHVNRYYGWISEWYDSSSKPGAGVLKLLAEKDGAATSVYHRYYRDHNQAMLDEFRREAIQVLNSSGVPEDVAYTIFKSDRLMTRAVLRSAGIEGDTITIWRRAPDDFWTKAGQAPLKTGDRGVGSHNSIASFTHARPDNDKSFGYYLWEHEVHIDDIQITYLNQTGKKADGFIREHEFWVLGREQGYTILNDPSTKIGLPPGTPAPKPVKGKWHGALTTLPSDAGGTAGAGKAKAKAKAGAPPPAPAGKYPPLSQHLLNTVAPNLNQLPANAKQAAIAAMEKAYAQALAANHGSLYQASLAAQNELSYHLTAAGLKWKA